MGTFDSYYEKKNLSAGHDLRSMGTKRSKKKNRSSLKKPLQKLSRQRLVRKGCAGLCWGIRGKRRSPSELLERAGQNSRMHKVCSKGGWESRGETTKKTSTRGGRKFETGKGQSYCARHHNIMKKRSWSAGKEIAEGNTSTNAATRQTTLRVGLALEKKKVEEGQSTFPESEHLVAKHR